MNRVRVSLMQLSFCFALVMAAVMVSQGSLDAQDCRIVRIYGGIPQYVEGIRIEPKTIWASKGTCVIWNNTMRTDEVKIVFEEGKKCDDMTDIKSFVLTGPPQTEDQTAHQADVRIPEKIPENCLPVQ